MGKDQVNKNRGGEDHLIAWLRNRAAPADGVDLIGDDAAILPAEAWAVTKDSQIEGVHFVPGTDPMVLAKRLLAVNLSDLAAMAARPRFAFLALAAPASFDHRRFLGSFTDACRKHELQLAGGDLAVSERVHLVLTLMGSRSGTRWLRRSGAEAGHDLWLGGPIGESAAGLELVLRGARWNGRSVTLPGDFEASERLCAIARHAVRKQLRPKPQLELGSWLGTQASGGGMDVSDGLSKDLHRLCRESQVGAIVDADALPIDRQTKRLAAHLGLSELALALNGGEDYVLLFTLPPDELPPPVMNCFRIGRCTREPDVWLQQGNSRRRLPARGWDHLDNASR